MTAKMRLIIVTLNCYQVLAGNITILVPTEYDREYWAKVSLWAMGFNIERMTREKQVNSTAQLVLADVHVPSTPSELPWVCRSLLDTYEPCAVAGPFGAQDASTSMAFAAADAGIVQVALSDAFADIYLNPKRHPTTVTAVPQLGPADDIPRFVAFLHDQKWIRGAVIVDFRLGAAASKFAEIARTAGIHLDIYLLNTNAANLQSEMSGLLANVKSQRHSIIGCFLAALPSDSRVHFYESAVDKGLTVKGTQWFFTGYMSGETPADFIRANEKPWASDWQGSLTFRVAAYTPKEDDPATWGDNGLLYKLPWLANYADVQRAATNRLVSESPRFNSHFYARDQPDCSKHPRRCNYVPPAPKDAKLMTDDVLYAHGGFLITLAIAERLHKAGLCNASTSKKQKELMQAVLDMEWHDPVLGYCSFVCLAESGFSTKELDKCISTPTLQLGFVVNLLGITYANCSGPEFGILKFLGWERTVAFIGPRGGAIWHHDSSVGRSLDIVSESCGPPPGMGGAREKISHFLPDSCGLRATVNETSVTADCIPCPRGLANPLDGSNRCSEDFAELCQSGSGWDFGKRQCEVCIPGQYSRPMDAGFGAALCTSCPAGTFSPKAASQVCTMCPGGKIASKEGAAECDLCPLGMFTAGLNRTNCHGCPTQMTTELPGSSSELKCRCPKGTYLQSSSCVDYPEGMSWTYPRNYPQNSICMACPEGMSCAGGHECPLLLPGYWSNNLTLESRVDTYLCSPAATCPGQETASSPACKPGRIGISCGLCAAGLYPCGTDCCTCGTQIPLAVLSISTLIIAIGFFVVSQSAKRNLPHKYLFIHPGQALAVSIVFFQYFVLLDLSGADGDGHNMDWGAVFLFDARAVALHPACIFGGDSFLGRYLARALTIPALGFGIVVWTALWRRIALWRCIVERMEGLRVPGPAELLNSLGLVWKILFVGVCVSVLQIMECYNSPHGRSMVKSFSFVQCGREQHDVGLAIMLPCLLLFVALPLALVVWALYKLPSKAALVSWRNATPFLVRTFRARAWWYSVVLMLRSLLIAMTRTFFPNSRRLQLLWAFLVCISVHVYSLYIQPFIHKGTNIMEVATCYILLVAIIVSVAGVEDTLSTPVKADLGTITSVVTVLMFVFPVIGGTLGLMNVLRTSSIVLMTQTQEVKVAGHAITLFQAIDAAHGDRWMETLAKLDFVERDALAEVVSALSREVMQLECHGIWRPRLTFSEEPPRKVTAEEPIQILGATVQESADVVVSLENRVADV
eukprot:TRINITY_DN9806_c0_g1_i1.p1 TRINITY_DN9806_c0_g1~~TRINITY_DN9806_c0_g1_i1.p1  ORF type:complete len:1260 (+),score=151.26 TRINITY_DN9806_c0_g1_i1:61-3840(+)